MVERRKRHEPYKPKHEERRDEFLSRSLLRHRSDVHTALNELSIMDEKIDAQRLGGPLKHRHEDPRLPIVERTCGNEQAREQNYERYQVGAISRSVSKPPSLGSSAASAAGVSSAAAGAAGAAVGADSPSAGSLVGSAGSAGSAGPLGLSGGLGELGF